MGKVLLRQLVLYLVVFWNTEQKENKSTNAGRAGERTSTQLFGKHRKTPTRRLRDNRNVHHLQEMALNFVWFFGGWCIPCCCSSARYTYRKLQGVVVLAGPEKSFHGRTTDHLGHDRSHSARKTFVQGRPPRGAKRMIFTRPSRTCMS